MILQICECNLVNNLKTKTFCTNKQMLAKNDVLFNEYGCSTTQPCAHEEIMGHACLKDDVTTQTNAHEEII